MDESAARRHRWLRDVALGAGLRLAFGTPILTRQHRGARVNRGLARAILDRERRLRGRIVSNVGGWHSAPDLLHWPEPEVTALRRWIASATRELLALRQGGARPAADVTLSGEAWAIVHREGSYSRAHIHPHNHWSGVYYVSTGRGPARRADGGLLVFADPRPGAEALAVPGFPFGGEYPIRPRPGLLVIFPSWLPHATTPFRGSGARISIAFNLSLEAAAHRTATRGGRRALRDKRGPT